MEIHYWWSDKYLVFMMCVNKSSYIAYHAAVMRLIDKFYFFKIDHVRRSQNSQADALAKLASALTLPIEGEIEIVIRDKKLIPSNIDRQNGLTTL